MSEKLVVWLDAHTRVFAEYFGGRRVDMNTILERVAAYEDIGPPSDLIRPVRCGECRKYMAIDCLLCSFDIDGYCTGGPDSDFYCADGERRQSDG